MGGRDRDRPRRTDRAAEYRNGGLLLDTGVLALRDDADARSAARRRSELVVEWRALTVTAARRARAGRADDPAVAGPASRLHPRGRHWAAGRELAHQLRGGDPPLTIRSDGTRVLNFHHPNDWSPHASNVHVLDHPLVQHKLTLLRKKETSTTSFRRLLNEIGTLMAYEVTREMPMHEVMIQTPLETMNSKLIDGKKLVFVPILRAGMGLLDGFLQVVPRARVGHIGLYRDPKTLVAVEYYFKMPGGMSERDAIVLDPMLATGNSAVAAVERPEGGEAPLDPLRVPRVVPGRHPQLQGGAPDVPIYTAAVDRELNDHGYSCRDWATPRPHLRHQVNARRVIAKRSERSALWSETAVRRERERSDSASRGETAWSVFKPGSGHERPGIDIVGREPFVHGGKPV